ncbi:hypothetical protein ABTF26_21145, partial [Acinetobacter baumannii]
MNDYFRVREEQFCDSIRKSARSIQEALGRVSIATVAAPDSVSFGMFHRISLRLQTSQEDG